MSGPLLKAVLQGKPPSANHLYYNRRGGGRGLTAEAATWKARALNEIHVQWSMRPDLDPARAYEVRLTFWLDKVLNDGWKTGKAKTRFKKIDVSGLVKILEDALTEATGVDDSNTTALILIKREDKNDPRIEVEISYGPDPDEG